VFHPGTIGTALPRDRNTIAYAVFSNNKAETGVWVVGADGSNPHRVDPAQPNCQQGGMGSLRADGKAILFSPGINCGLMSVNIDGTGLKTVDRQGGCLFSCDWAPDGRSIVYEKGSHVVLAAADGSQATEIAEGTAPQWSPTGTTIAYQDKSSNLAVYDLSTTSSRVVGSFQGGLFNPSFDPDGKRLVAHSNAGLRVVDIASGRVSPICTDAGALAQHPSWSPAGDAIAYNAESDLAICDVASGKVRTFATPAGYSAQHPFWR
jgi:Tol biopolymer transport system component